MARTQKDMGVEQPDSVLIYCRVSSTRQAQEDRESLDAQERGGRVQAGTRPIYRVVRSAESAWVLDARSEFQQVLAEGRAGLFTVLIVDRMDRLTRSEDLGEYMQIVTELRLAGVRLEFSDKQYAEGPTGQLQQMFDAYASAQEQAMRRARVLTGKRGRVRRQQPIPAPWALFGYRWIDERKTRMEFDPTTEPIVRRIWSAFLDEGQEYVSLAGLVKQLNQEGVLTPRQYAGTKTPKNAPTTGLRWTTETVRGILHHEVYWGGDADGMVHTFTTSKHNTPTLIPAYAPRYVTREQAQRAHARLAENRRRHAHRKGKRDWPLLLYAGLARCGTCGWAMEVHQDTRARVDGSMLMRYRCSQRSALGKSACPGMSLSADVLDQAIMAALDSRVNNGAYLKELFAAWHAEAEAAERTVHTIEQTLQETEQQVNNLAARLARYHPADPAAGPVEHQMRLLADMLPGLRERRQAAMTVSARTRNNPALRDDLGDWFDGWLAGFSALPLQKQRAFLFSLRAKVLVSRASDGTPRATLHLLVPQTTAVLPPAPQAIELDLVEGAQRAALERDHTYDGMRVTIGGWDATSAAGVAEATPAAEHTAADVMADIVATLDERGYAVATPGVVDTPILTSQIG